MRKAVSKISPFLKVVMLLVIGITTFVYAMFQGGFVSWFLFYSTSLIVIITIIYAFMPIGKLEVKRTLNGERLVAGIDLKVTITIERKFRFPFLYFIVEDVIPSDWELKNKNINSKEIIYPSLEKYLVYSYKIKEPKRGEYQFTKVKVRTSDPFGVFTKEKEITVHSQVIIYPNYEQLDNWSMYNENEAEAYITSQRLIEDVTSVAGSREYVPGDRLTSIDWKVTARTNKLMTKEFEEYLGQRFLVSLDCSIKNQNQVLTFERAVELATSFVVHSYQEQFPVGLQTIGERVSRYPIHFGEAHQASILEHLAKLNFHIGNAFDFVFVNEMGKITSDTILVVISTRLTDAMVENLRRLKKKRVQTIFCFVSNSKSLTAVEQNRLTLITNLDISHYILGENHFGSDLKGGKSFAQK